MDHEIQKKWIEIEEYFKKEEYHRIFLEMAIVLEGSFKKLWQKVYFSSSGENRKRLKEIEEEYIDKEGKKKPNVENMELGLLIGLFKRKKFEVLKIIENVFSDVKFSTSKGLLSTNTIDKLKSYRNEESHWKENKIERMEEDLKDSRYFVRTFLKESKLIDIDEVNKVLELKLTFQQKPTNNLVQNLIALFVGITATLTSLILWGVQESPKDPYFIYYVLSTLIAVAVLWLILDKFKNAYDQWRYVGLLFLFFLFFLACAVIGRNLTVQHAISIGNIDDIIMVHSRSFWPYFIFLGSFWLGIVPFFFQKYIYTDEEEKNDSEEKGKKNQFRIWLIYISFLIVAIILRLLWHYFDLVTQYKLN